MGFSDLFKSSSKESSNDNFYEEDLVTKCASISESLYEFNDIQYGEDFTPSTEELRKFLQAAMSDLGHPDPDMELLNKSQSYYLVEGDLKGNPNYLLDCPDFSKYM